MVVLAKILPLSFSPLGLPIVLGMSCFPSAASLERTTRSDHEYYALFVYKVLGRI